MQANLDFIAHRYGCRPSDLFFSDTARIQIDFICALAAIQSQGESQTRNPTTHFSLPPPTGDVIEIPATKGEQGVSVEVSGFSFPLSKLMQDLL